MYQFLAHGRWFSPGTPASSTTKTSRHDIAEILLKVALDTINQSINQSSNQAIKQSINQSINQSIISTFYFAYFSGIYYWYKALDNHNISFITKEIILSVLLVSSIIGRPRRKRHVDEFRVLEFGRIKDRTANLRHINCVRLCRQF